MNQEKIGKFIATLRKEKNLTQQQLAEKLGVSDKTIGNWENGRNMPDLSLFKPLCEELSITINDLISGEKVKEQEYQEKLEENIINTIDYSNKKIEQKNSLIGFILFVLGFLFIIFGIMVFNPDSHGSSFSVVIGLMIAEIGFYKMIKKNTYIKRMLYFLSFTLVFLSIILLFDFIGVKYNSQPPMFAKTITTEEDAIYYDTFFYDVIRCHRNTKEETYYIIKNSDYNYSITDKYCLTKKS